MPAGYGYGPEGIRAFLADLSKGGYRGSPMDRGLKAIHREVLDPAGRALRRTIRGDAMSGDIGLGDLGRTRPARAMVGLGEQMAGAFRSAEGFANRMNPRIESFLRRLR